MNEQNELEQLKYPIGRFKKNSENFTQTEFLKIVFHYGLIENFPENLRMKNHKINLSDNQLDTPYRKWLDNETSRYIIIKNEQSYQ